MSEVQIRAIASALRRHVPPILPVRVHFRDALEDGAWGTASLRMQRGRVTHFLITLRRAHIQIMRDTLCHEWGHCLAWREGAFVEDHGPEWGLAMSAVYRAMEDL